ncbi:MAG TPA: carboxymuconolactone decarboxylase family protein [Vicinamibacterales bacterium]|jgi:alkyl hydroperoxide reductase subunit D|nr:carboxymuconolactone decarboxylase family protein [Vicinamibacterales bacterium]
MAALDAIRDALPETARDIKLNVQSVLQDGSLSAAQRWGVAVTSAATARNRPLLDAIVADARTVIDPAVIDDALAAAALMAMNNVYYRFRHMVGKPGYEQKPARLRMNRLAKPAGSKADLELFSLAASAINGCEICVQAHEKAVIDAGLTEDNVHDAVRIAATIHAAALAFESFGVTVAA